MLMSIIRRRVDAHSVVKTVHPAIREQGASYAQLKLNKSDGSMLRLDYLK
jgi:hypothetical protein